MIESSEVNAMYVPLVFAPAISSTSERSAPFHCAAPIAPHVHCVKPAGIHFPASSAGSRGKNARTFAPQSRTASSVTAFRAWICASVTLHGFDTASPLIATDHVAGLMTGGDAARLWM